MKNKKMTIRKRTFPYAYARVSAMKAKLLQAGEYHKLLKMDLPGITKYLQESEYSDEITRNSAKFAGIELIDYALKENQESVFDKLRRICPDDVERAIGLYLERADYQNLKIVLRGLFSNSTKEEVASILEPIGRFSEAHFISLFETGSMIKALRESRIVDEKDIKKEYESYKESGKLIVLENRLDSLYFQSAIKGAASLDRHGRAFREFLLRDIDMVNIKNLLRFAREGLPRDEVFSHMLIRGLRLNKAALRRLASKDSLESLYAELGKTYYAKHVRFEGRVRDVELTLQKYHMKNVFLRNYDSPLSIVSIINYMMAKIVELRNIRSIVKGRQLGIEADYIENNLLVI